MATAQARTQRAEVRLLPVQKRRIERAASHKGISFSDFMVQAADEAAGRTIEQHETWILSERDMEAFACALLNPGEPNEQLKAASRRYKDFIREDIIREA